MFLRKISEILRDLQESELNAALAAFSCKDRDVENYLKTKAVEHERRNKSRTYLLLESTEDLKILAYFTLSVKILAFGTGLSKTQVQKIDGFNKDAKATPVMLIGQFGKDEHAAGKVQGDKLMQLCQYHLEQAQKIVGGRAVLAECLPIPAVIAFYERNGFALLQEDETDKYHQMILMM
jgi:hypothetical protein